MSSQREVLIRILALWQRKTLLETKNRTLKCLKRHYSTVQSMKNVAVLTEDGAFALCFRPHPGEFDRSRVPTPGNLPSKARKMLMPGVQPGNGGGGGGLAWLMHNLFYGKQGSIRKGQSTLKILHRQWKYLVRLKNKILHRFKRCYCEKTLLRTKIRVLHLCFHVSVVVDLPTDCIISFLFLSETDVLVPVFSQPTDVVVVNFVVVLKFPFMSGNLLNITRDEYLTDQALLPYTETKGD